MRRIWAKLRTWVCANSISFRSCGVRLFTAILIEAPAYLHNGVPLDEAKPADVRPAFKTGA